MTGCAIPLSCEAIFVDDSSGNGLARGAIHLGPALVGASVNESDVLYYEVFWADSCEDRMGSTALGQAQAGMGDACCRSDVYSVPIDSRPPEGATGWVVYSAMRGGRAPVGVFVPLNQTMLNAIVIGNNAHFSQTVWIVFWLAVAIIGF